MVLFRQSSARMEFYSGMNMFGHGSARTWFCSDRILLGWDSARTEFCSAFVTLLGHSVQTGFCSDRVLLGLCHSIRAECSDVILLGHGSVRTEFCSDGILLGQSFVRHLSLCSGRVFGLDSVRTEVFGRDSVRTEFCSAVVTLLGQSVRMRFCSARILLGRCHSVRVFGRDSARTEFCSAVVTLLGQSVRTGFCSDKILLGLCHSARAECSDGILFGQNSAHSARAECSDGILFGQNSALCSGRVFGRDSIRTEFCLACVTLLGQSVRTGFYLDKILLGLCHSARAECSDGILFGQNSARPLSLCSGRVFGRDSVRTEFCSAFVTLLGQSVRTGFCSDRILLGLCHSARAECSDRILFGQNSARPLSLCSGSEVGTSNPQLPLASTSHPFQPSTSQPLPPSSSQPSHSLSRKNTLGDVKDQADDKANPKPWYTADEKLGKMSIEDLQDLIWEYPLPEGWYTRLPGLQEPTNYGTKFETGIYEEQVKSGYRLPLYPFALRFFEHYRMAPGQLVLNGWRKLAGLIYLVQTSGYKPDATDFMRVFFEICFVKGVANCPGWYYIHSRQLLLKEGPKSNKGWHSRYFFVGCLDNGELPFERDWNPFSGLLIPSPPPPAIPSMSSAETVPMYASGSEMLSRFEMARQVAAEEAQQKRDAFKEAQEATHRAEELSNREEDYLAKIATLEKRLE
ncbi:hypothetical protein RJ639_038427 [Escallonia herrerae]|uniref:Uncharacterized protein n=1 Tax=Escallonia herrerae TaxID=1293975 RepID=A0AA88WMX7_9ASTE|nr:hypothetical protein RJ639_038427 [Escallonia herrerae]